MIVLDFVVVSFVKLLYVNFFLLEFVYDLNMKYINIVDVVKGQEEVMLN